MKSAEQVTAESREYARSIFPSDRTDEALIDRVADAYFDGYYEGRGEPRPAAWAICEGGLIQDSSEGVETIDLDWLDSGDVDIEEAEGCWSLLHRITEGGAHSGWDTYLTDVRERLEIAYTDAGYDPEQYIWNQEES